MDSTLPLEQNTAEARVRRRGRGLLLEWRHCLERPNPRLHQTGRMAVECSKITANRRQPAHAIELAVNTNVAGDRLTDGLRGAKAVSHPHRLYRRAVGEQHQGNPESNRRDPERQIEILPVTGPAPAKPESS